MGTFRQEHFDLRQVAHSVQAPQVFYYWEQNDVGLI